MKGWIKLHRRILGNLFYGNPTFLAVWIHILLSANHEERDVAWNGSVIHLRRGQVLTGRKKMAESVGIPETTLERTLEKLENGHQIGQQKTTKYRIITVLNWDKFQNRTTERTANGQQNGHKQEGIKNAKEITMGGFNKYSDDYLEGELQIDPDHTPKVKKKPAKVSDDVQAVFDLFDNPARALWVLREVERVAAKTLFDTYGIEKLKIRLERIKKEKKKADPFFPHADTPSQLLDKMPNIERYFNI